MENEKFEDVLRNRNGRALLVKFGAVWCGPCRTMQPILEEFAERWAEYIDVFSVDVDEDPEVANRFKVRTVPTIIFFSPDGQLLDRHHGTVPLGLLNSMVGRYYR